MSLVDDILKFYKSVKEDAFNQVIWHLATINFLITILQKFYKCMNNGWHKHLLYRGRIRYCKSFKSVDLIEQFILNISNAAVLTTTRKFCYPERSRYQGMKC